MGMPITSKQEDSSTQQENLSSSSVDYSMNANGNNNINNGVESEGGVSCLFVYGSSRPDAPANAQNQLGFRNRRAWLLGSRLYSFDTGGVQRAAVKLDEAGHAVLGYAISTNNSLGITSVLDEYERREYSPDFYERDIVEVVGERGEHLQAYIYHRADVNPRNLIPSGDWLRR